MKVQPVDPTRVEQLVQMHVGMYTGGHGGVIFDPLDPLHTITITSDISL